MILEKLTNQKSRYSHTFVLFALKTASSSDYLTEWSILLKYVTCLPCKAWETKDFYWLLVVDLSFHIHQSCDKLFTYISYRVILKRNDFINLGTFLIQYWNELTRARRLPLHCCLQRCFLCLKICWDDRLQLNLCSIRKILSIVFTCSSWQNIDWSTMTDQGWPVWKGRRWRGGTERERSETARMSRWGDATGLFIRSGKTYIWHYRVLLKSGPQVDHFSALLCMRGRESSVRP